MKDRNDKLIYVNCDDERDLKAFVAWQKLFPLGQDAGITDELCKEISDEWKRVKQELNKLAHYRALCLTLIHMNPDTARFAMRLVT
ncbi:putative Retrotransposon hot spot protein [Trypanosoma vivax]|nr:putative Retrotransposon hot spot protein [Trypanosoma vivax]